MSLIRVLTAAVLLALCGAQQFSAYFANWAQYHKAPYGPYTPDKLSGIMDQLDSLQYSFAYFDSSTFAIKLVEPKDPAFIKTISSMKGKTKFILSVGGWNFPSAYFSSMVSSNTSRSSFISSLQSTMTQYGFDGIDIDWEYPCSPPRTDYVKYSCDKVTPSQDAGGKCPDDTTNLLYLVQEIRRAIPDCIITIASQAAEDNYGTWPLKAMSDVIDMFHVMTYDYSVSDLNDATLTAPNAPLYDPGYPVAGKAANWSVDSTVKGYQQMGVPSSKIMVGLALYGHTWYVPNLQTPAWQRFGVPATVQGQCCGAFKQTYGAKYGAGSQLCGTLMVSEISDKLGSLDGYQDASGSVIGYAIDGTWISYDNEKSFLQKVDYVKKNKLGGVFMFDTSMDIGNYEMMNAVANALKGSGPSPGPTPGPSPPSFCQGKTAGMYCTSSSDYEWCPQGVVQHCPAGKKCKQQGTSATCA